MEEQPPFEVTDKRRVHIEDEAPAEPAAEEAMEGPSPEEPEQSLGEMAETLPPMDVYGIIGTTINLLANGAWAWIGLSPDPFTGKMNKDLAQAKVAIDAVQSLVGHIEPRLTEEERRDLRNMVSNLQINYVQQANAGKTE